MRDDMLFNCCTDYTEPVWSRFAALTISGVRDLRKELPGDETECVACDDDEAEFWTVYGRTHEGDVEALTDAPTKDRALVIAGFHMCLARIAGVRIELPEE
jgi:hypothetical protein